ncbi:MAG: hypothetical protein COT14_02035 [Candidatus Diapherotrites archaeon CG08_land_8_20_14_0_20_30_16]|nr:MAG: hypothetical protein COT14_02035 [Candidatus Diapherotrites archaeon CG08_land_8_20_14_0_20_30_16]
MSLFASKEKRNKAILVLLVLIILFIVCFFLIKTYFKGILDIDYLLNFIKGMGVFAPLAMILIQIVQVLLPPIPGQITFLVSGYIFGFWFGCLYTLIGVTIGSVLAFLIARVLGRPFVNKVFKKDSLEWFDSIAEKNGPYILFWIFVLPGFPDDTLCFIAGLTKMKLSTFLLVTVVGRIPSFIVLTLIGAGLIDFNNWLEAFIIGLSLIVSLIVYLLKDKFKDLVRK